ncbi:VRR-NUC domain-containing protein [Falsirhodobacter halotolerans]|uniref:VRR-NUC domain-containing protein n=1 Tax=Falsirhodobacter halotolerans TaxID=1146892 RepID=UPI001FD38FD5|nr:VRR-NUC domain-containing protein [Falsirhodobacter halotolerans]MCJ8138583.1 VRR-NUC domain-containing protein [Falsirhodobacter halotolerans]
MNVVRQSEQEIHIGIVAFLRAVLPANAIIMHARNEGNRGGRRGVIDGARGKAMGVQPGWPDLLIYTGGRGFAIEVKRSGEKMTLIQEAVAAQLSCHGIPHSVCRSIEDVRAALSAWGVTTKERTA